MISFSDDYGKLTIGRAQLLRFKWVIIYFLYFIFNLLCFAVLYKKIG